MFEAFLNLKAALPATQISLDDCMLLKIVSEFTHVFYIVNSTEPLRRLCGLQSYAFLLLFFKDKDVVEKCQIDFCAGANSQETDPDSDDENLEMQSEAEPIRFEIINMLVKVLNNSEGHVSDPSKEELVYLALPLVIKEMSQVNAMKSLETCLEALISITAINDT